MFYPFLTSIVTLITLGVYFFLIINVSRARAKYGVVAPATTGSPEFERVLRVQINTTEQLILFLPLLWINASLTTDQYAAIIGSVWVIGRIIFTLSYYKDANKRAAGIAISYIANLFLFGGAVWGLIQYFNFAKGAAAAAAGM